MISKVLSLFLAVSSLLSHSAHCADVRIMSSGAYEAALIKLAPEFARTSQDGIVAVATSMGVGSKYIPTRVRAGEIVDIVILADEILDELVAEGHIAASSRTPLARSSIGMAVRSGVPKPDISSVDALKRTLLGAKSIAYSSQSSGRYVSTELFVRLGIADDVKGKTKRVEGERVGAVVARGEAEVGFQQISELLPIQGIDYVGPIPHVVQRITRFSAAVATRSTNSDAAERVIRFLASPTAAAITAKTGLEPITPR